MNIQKVLKNIESRKKTTLKGKELIQELFQSINKKLEGLDAVTGYQTEKTFHMEYSVWDGRNWREAKDEFQLGLREGQVEIFFTGFPVPFDIEGDFVDSVKYINFTEFVEVLREFLENLKKIPTFEKDVGILSECLRALR